VITGFNTDIEHAGITYHVQTEDKGLDTPLILSLVYVGGAILASKRTSYQDLLETGFNLEELTERLNRQHKLICAAIRAGRIEDLKRMSGREAPAVPTASAAAPTQSVAAAAPPTVVVPPTAPRETPAPVAPPRSEPPPQQARRASRSDELEILSLSDAETFDPIIPTAPPSSPPTPAPVVAPPPEPPPPSPTTSALSESAAVPEAVQAAREPEAAFYIRLLDDEGEFRAGELVMIRVYVGRGQYGKIPIAGAAVTIKVLGTTFRPLIVSTETDQQGIAVVRALLPRFTSGRAAILIRARSDGYEAELRRIIKQN
jgi:hypothetical protein